MIKKIINKTVEMIRLSAFRKGAIVGERLQVDVHSVCINRTGRRDAIRIGDHCCIRGRLAAIGDGQIRIGNNCYIGGGSLLGATESVVLGDCVMIAPDVRIMDNNNHPVEPHLREEMCRSGDYFGPLWNWDQAAHAPVIIGNNVWIGERSAILKGVQIGEGSVVACHSVVTKDVPPYTMVAGNPARVVKHLERE